MRFTILVSAALTAATTYAQALDNRYIVLLHEGSDIDAYICKITAQGDVRELTRWTEYIYGVNIYSESHTVDTLAAFPEVELVEEDKVITIPDCNVEPCARGMKRGLRGAVH